MACSTTLNIGILAHFPDIAEAMLARDWTFVNHGFYNTRAITDFSEEQEREFYQEIRGTFRRLTNGSGRLDEMTSAELKSVAFKATGDRMISVGELCDLVAGRVTLVIELKSGRAGDQRLASRAAAVLTGYAGPAAVMSFDPAQIVALRSSAPHVTRGLVAQGRSGRFGREQALARAKRAFAYGRDALRAHPQFIAYSVKDLPAALPLAARHLCGMPLLTWTVRSPEDRQRAARWADQMIFEGFRP